MSVVGKEMHPCPAPYQPRRPLLPVDDLPVLTRRAGVDFGTHKTVIAVARNRGVDVVSRPGSPPTQPSYGVPARNAY